MKKKEKNTAQLFEELLTRYPQLTQCRTDIEAAFVCLLECARNHKKILIAGNGGSAADSEHIVGELLKSFLFFRKIDEKVENELIEKYGDEGKTLAGALEGAIPAIPLTSMPAMSTAFANDVNAAACFAQMVHGLGAVEDVFFGITTSGNSENIKLALMTARVKEMKSVLLTGGSGGVCRGLADVVICVPEKETFKIQELHLPVYHTLCAMLEAELFEER